MLIRKLYLSLAAIVSICYSAAVYSIELVDVKEPLAKEAVFTSIQNTSLSPIFLTFSNGFSIELEKKTGKLLPCSDTQGLLMFVSIKPSISDLSINMECGHSYTVKENAQ